MKSALPITVGIWLCFAPSKSSPLSHKRRLKGRNIVIGKFGGLEVKSKCIEGWTSFTSRTLYEIPNPPLKRRIFKGRR
jgi:hypothetical protein